VSSSLDVRVRLLQEGDLDETDRIYRVAFGTFLGLPDPATAGGDADLVRTRWLADPSAAFVAEMDGQVVGSNFATHWGSFGFFGPLTVRPDLWDKGIARRLLRQTMERFAAWDCHQLGLFTFPHSPKHLALYQRFGFWPQSLTALMAKSVGAAPASARWIGLTDMSASERQRTVEICRELTDAISPGLDVRREIEAVSLQRLGDSVLVHDASELAAFAVCHVGAGTEAGSDACFIKFGAVRPGPTASQHFEHLLGACEAFAAGRGAGTLVGGVNTARHAAYQAMLAGGFRIVRTGVAMQRPNEAGFNHRHAYVIDDWR
jgi:predicted N-acetyltransferase YhbS